MRISDWSSDVCSSDRTDTIHFDVQGVVAQADGGFKDYDGQAGAIGQDGDTVRIAEDGSTDPADQGAESQGLVVDVRYTASTQDGDGSEGITRIVLDKGASDGTFVSGGTALVDGQSLTIGTATATASFDQGGNLVLSFAAPGVEAVDLSGVIGIQLPVDDSTDFTVTVTTTTTEYDDEIGRAHV